MHKRILEIKSGSVGESAEKFTENQQLLNSPDEIEDDYEIGENMAASAPTVTVVAEEETDRQQISSASTPVTVANITVRANTKEVTATDFVLFVKNSYKSEKSHDFMALMDRPKVDIGKSANDSMIISEMKNILLECVLDVGPPVLDTLLNAFGGAHRFRGSNLSLYMANLGLEAVDFSIKNVKKLFGLEKVSENTMNYLRSFGALVGFMSGTRIMYAFSGQVIILMEVEFGWPHVL
jgi:hypothetical protein